MIQKKTKSTTKTPPLLQTEFHLGLEAQVLAEVKKAVKTAGFDESLVTIDHPTDSKFGDFTTNIAMILFSQTASPNFPKIPNKPKNPLDLAKKIQLTINDQQSAIISKVDVAPPGFLNIWIKNSVLINQLREVIKLKEKYGNTDFLKDKGILLEHTSPDPIKTIHIGHLRNNFLGMAMYRLFQSLGAKVTLDCINNDRGTHVSRAMFGYLAFAKKSLNLPQKDLLNFKIKDEKVKEIASEADWKKLLDEWLTSPGDWLKPEDLSLKSDHLDLIFYSLGDRSERLVKGIKEQVREILRAWEEEKPKVRALWRQIIDWSLAGYALTYKRIGSHHDKVWHESDLYKGGKALVKQGLEKGIFKKSQGAIVTDLSAFSLPDTVVIKSDDTAVYHTFDIYFTAQKRANFPSDLYIWDIGNDQLLYLRQLFAVCEQLEIGKVEDYYHLNYGYVYLKGGQKMSSRQGTVITADELLDFLKTKARQIMLGAQKKPETTSEASPQARQGGRVERSGTSDSSEVNGGFSPQQIDEISEKVGLAAIKYGLLKTNRSADIHFDPETSVNLTGNSGPYLQYTCARAHSVLKKALEKKIIFSLSEYDLFRGQWAGAASGFIPGAISSLPKPPTPPKTDFQFNKEEKTLLRTIYRYPEVILAAGKRLEPALICQFLFDLAAKFNTFYNHHSILALKNNDQGQTLPNKTQKDTVSFRLTLTATVAQILKNGLTLLGIDPLERM